MKWKELEIPAHGTDVTWKKYLSREDLAVASGMLLWFGKFEERQPRRVKGV